MNELSKRYAAALFALTQQEQTVCQTAALLQEQPLLWQALLSPVIKPREKGAVLRRLPFLAQEPILLHFYQLLCDKGRLELLPEILAAYQDKVLQAAQRGVCHMTCVHPPQSAQRQQLIATLCRLHNMEDILLDVNIDPDILGGFILRIQGVTYDRSVRGQLSRLEKHLQERRIV